LGEKKWSLFQSGSGAFAVLMPGNPKETVTEEPRTNAAPIRLYHFAVDPDDSIEFEVDYNDYPKDLPFVHLVGTEWYFDQVQENVVRKFHGRLISSNDLTFRDYPAREFKFEVAEKGLSYDMRLIVVRQRQYQLIIASDIGADVSKDKATFFNSLILNY
jgi:hypothetical protein